MFFLFLGFIMQKYSHLLNAFKVALVCGVTFIPFGEANAKSGWNDIVASLENTSPEELGKLKVLLDRKQEEAKAQHKRTLSGRWNSRLVRYNIMVNQGARLNDFKKILSDKGQFKKPLNVQEESKRIFEEQKEIVASSKVKPEWKINCDELTEKQQLSLAISLREDKLRLLYKAATYFISEFWDCYDLEQRVKDNDPWNMIQRGY